VEPPAKGTVKGRDRSGACALRRQRIQQVHKRLILPPGALF